MENKFFLKKLAGAAGFEPANAGIKSRCLTAWRRPKNYDAIQFPMKYVNKVQYYNIAIV
tara:strand:+ start:224 stop:400 length:177 start_codon:yes stop_codon:yes gene_type:complete